MQKILLSCPVDWLLLANCYLSLVCVGCLPLESPNFEHTQYSLNTIKGRLLLALLLLLLVVIVRVCRLHLMFSFHSF